MLWLLDIAKALAILWKEKYERQGIHCEDSFLSLPFYFFSFIFQSLSFFLSLFILTLAAKGKNLENMNLKWLRSKKKKWKRTLNLKLLFFGLCFYLKDGPSGFMDPVLEGWRSLAAFTDEHKCKMGMAFDRNVGSPIGLKAIH